MTYMRLASIWFDSRAALCTACLLAFVAPAWGAPQSPPTQAAQPAPPVVVSGVPIHGPTPPAPPAVETRDGDTRVTIRAVRLTEPLRIDGQLDETHYHDVQPISGFVQLEPDAGAPATEKTELWIAFDDDTLYITFRCWDSQPESRWLVNEMRRDHGNIPNNENVAFWFDTFYDQRNASVFEISPLGGIWDAQLVNGRNNVDWNPVWARRTGRFEGGWTAEIGIPFKSLRYKPGASQVWGFNARRTVRWKNEDSFLTRVPRRGGNARGSIFLIANGATLVGLDAPPGSSNLEIKPYAVSSLSTDRQSKPIRANDPDGDLGVDVKYGLTQNLTADLTYNTDFAQVEVDAQQVNLTRFSLFYPEKRDFFLENQGIFDFGGAGGNATSGGVTPLLFFSRRIGLNGSQVVPIRAGGRLTGKVGKFTVGFLDVQTGQDSTTVTPATNFSVVRVKRDILRRSSFGAIFTGRSVSTLGMGSSETYGVDAALGFGSSLNINTFLAKTATPGIPDDDMSSRLAVNYNGDRYGLEVDRLAVGSNFRPEVGYVQRDDLRRSYALARFSPRLRSVRHLRRFLSNVSFDYIADGRGTLETREASAQVGVEFENADEIDLQHSRYYEFLKAPFRIAPGVVIPVGGYSFEDSAVSLKLENIHRLSGTISLAHGSFYSGYKTTLGLNSGRFQVTPRIILEPATSINWIDLVEGSFTSATASTRATYTVTPFMFFSGLVQYNSSTRVVSSNVRLRWEYLPGSEFFVVYTDERDTAVRDVSSLRNRAVVVKINRLLGF